MLKNKKTTVYFAEYCIHCSNLKDWLKENNIPFTALNTEDPEISKELVDCGVQAIPFTVITDQKTGES
ncbi:Glutaredoxin [Niallia nealsonii AAU1]|nr:Glutaredoxin [Niallia nealsonii AAU1]